MYTLHHTNFDREHKTYYQQPSYCDQRCVWGDQANISLPGHGHWALSDVLSRARDLGTSLARYPTPGPTQGPTVKLPPSATYTLLPFSGK